MQLGRSCCLELGGELSDGDGFFSEDHIYLSTFKIL